ncbi:ABC transporter permease [Plantactinospora sp. B5E13]|uniref:ABC transporter permease n=1 Tax=unclassified Plantactinospora TaxID=2631981 RepID=UPI00325D3AF3
MAAVLRLVLAGVRGGNRATALAAVVVAALATAGIVAGLSVRDQGGPRVDRLYVEAGRPDLVVYGTPEALETVRRDRALADSSPVVRYVAATVALHAEPVDARVDALSGPAATGGNPPGRAPTVDGPDPGTGAGPGRPLLRTGRWPVPGATDEVVFDRAAATDAGIRVGDRVEVTVAGRPYPLTVVGTAIDLTDCFHPDCDPIRLFVDAATLSRLAPAPGDTDTGAPTSPDPTAGTPTSPAPGRSGALLVGRLTDPADAEAVAARLLADGQVTGVQTWADTRDDILIRDRIFGASLAGFGLFVLVAAAFVVAGTATARLLVRRREIALLASVGYTGRQLVAGLVGEIVLLGTTGALAGGIAGSLLAPYLQVGLTNPLGRPAPRIAPLTLLGAGVLVVLILGVATGLPALRAARQPASEVLRDRPPRAVTPDRVARLLDRLRLGTTVRYGIGAVLVRPGRTALTAGAVAVAVAALVVGGGFTATMDRLVAEPAYTGDPYDVVVAPASGTDPQRLVAALSGIPEVGGWYSQTDRRALLGDRTFLSRAVGGDPDDAGFVVREGRPLRAAGEALVGYGLLHRLDLRVGDTVPVRVDDIPLTLTVVGWYSETEDTGEVLLYRAEQLPGVPPDAFLVSAQPEGTPGALAAVLRDRLGTDATVRIRASDPDELGTFTVAVRLMAGLLLAVGLAHLGTGLLSGARERSRALGVLRAVGFTVRQTVGQAAAGGAALGLLAASVGLPLGLVAHRLLADRATIGMGAGPGLAEAPPLFLLLGTVPGTVLAGAVAGALATRRLARRAASELVRWE